MFGLMGVLAWGSRNTRFNYQQPVSEAAWSNALLSHYTRLPMTGRSRKDRSSPLRGASRPWSSLYSAQRAERDKVSNAVSLELMVRWKRRVVVTLPPRGPSVLRGPIQGETSFHFLSSVRCFVTWKKPQERIGTQQWFPTSGSRRVSDEIEMVAKLANALVVFSSTAEDGEIEVRISTYSRDKENQRPAGHLPPNTTLQRHVRSNRNVHIPRFYYPQGKPTSEHQMEVALKKISAVFHQFPNQQVVKDKFHLVTKACDCPLYWKMPLFVATGGEKLGHVESNTFLDFWKKLLLSCHDQASWFIHILTRGLRDHLTPDDLGAMVQDVVDSHPGLTFLKEATEFHSRYVHTEIADKEIASFPLNSCPTRIHSRCALTSRSRGLVKRWRLSRIVWRHYADYNKLSGVQRAMW
uniref:Uncharacterized protein n=1 Tax=Timema cristinae TaxID=61476 RepID=A0A7R9CW92_TIMCR|nr:unnamed protein product [Timema cristinae]